MESPDKHEGQVSGVDIQLKVDQFEDAEAKNKPAKSELDSEAVAEVSEKLDAATLEPCELKLGSDAWMDFGEFEQYNPAAAEFANGNVNWDSLLEVCSDIRGGMPCKLGDKFTAGNFNLVRQVIFDDGDTWTARILMDKWFWEYPEDLISTEVASYQFLKIRTSIPVPEVYGFSSNKVNPVGALYTLVEYIHGSPGNDVVQHMNDGLDPSLGTEHDEALHRQLAALQSDLAAIRTDKIGCIYVDAETSSDFTIGGFGIGRHPITGYGPWTSSPEFVKSRADEIQQDLFRPADEDRHVIEADGSIMLPTIAEVLFERSRDPSLDHGPFGLAIHGFGARKVLVNQKLEIVGLTGVAGLMAVPVEAQAQFPLQCGLDYAPPTLQEELYGEDREKLFEQQPFADMLAECDERIEERTNGDFPPRLGEQLKSVSALAYLALLWAENGSPDDVLAWMTHVLRLFMRSNFRERLP